MSWKITHIYEADFGCEERPAGAVDRCIVYLENEEGEKRQIEADDQWLTANGIVEGSLWPETGKYNDKDCNLR